MPIARNSNSAGMPQRSEILLASTQMSRSVPPARSSVSTEGAMAFPAYGAEAAGP